MVGVVVAALVVGAGGGAGATDRTDDEPAASGTAMTWAPVPIGGGGYVTGLVVGPGDRLYARSDVGGAYRRQARGGAWVPLVTADRTHTPLPADYRVASIAVAPSDADVVYLATGEDSDDPAGRVLASRDGGATFTASRQRWSLDGNGSARWAGERLAVDPRRPEVVWLGVQDGLWRSTDGGTTWSELTSIPGDNPASSPGGVTVVVVDGRGPVDRAGRALRVWAGVEGVGVVRSDDGGTTWRTVLPTPGIIQEIEVDARGDLLVVGQRGPDDALLWRISGSTVTDIAPAGAGRLRTVAADPRRPERLFLTGPGMRDRHLWRSTDGGATWARLRIAITSPVTAWPTRTTLDRWMSAGELVFDSAGTLWFAEGTGVWRSTDLADDEVTWTFDSAGIENLVTNDIEKVPGGPLLSAHWDRGLFVHDRTALPHLADFDSAWSIAVSPTDPRRVAVVVDNHQRVADPRPEDRQSAVSADGGRTFGRMGSLRSGVHPPELKFGNIAISATDPRLLVWAPSEGGRIHRSTDGGATWRPARRNPAPTYYGAYYLHRHVLSADPVDGRTFYLLSEDGVLRSTDGGDTWQVRPSRGLPRWNKRWNATLAAVPGRRGELLLSLGRLSGGVEHPLFHSTDAGATWTPLPAAPEAGPFGLGAPAHPGGPPVVWVESRDRAGDRAILRSTDGGATFETMATHPLGRYDRVTVVAGDPDDPGTVYVGYAGTGLLVGRTGGGGGTGGRSGDGGRSPRPQPVGGRPLHRPGLVGPDGPVTIDLASGRPVRLRTGATRPERLVAVAERSDGRGTWAVDPEGVMFVTGAVAHRGDLGRLALNQPVLGMTPTDSGEGYWMVASDGGVFGFGDAGFHGSMGGVPLNRPVTGMAVTRSGRGYYLVASDGGIFAFGDAAFLGSMGGVPLNQPINGMAVTPSGRGYWMAASDGGVFGFGDAGFHGSLGGRPLDHPVIGMIPTDSGAGYWLVDAAGRSFPFGDARTAN